MIVEKYYKENIDILTKILNTQKGKIEEASRIVSETIKKDGIIYVFGCGHSHLIGLDSFYRAGGLASVSAILDTDLMLHNGAAKSSHMERMSGIAEEIVKRYCITEKDVLIVVSTSGKNAVPVEAAKCARERGIKTIGIVSGAYFNDAPIVDRLLYECVDVYIDNCVPHGDAVMDITGADTRMGSLSTVASSFIMQSLLMEASETCGREGVELPVYMSGNVEGGKEYNKKIIEKYLPRIKHL